MVHSKGRILYRLPIGIYLVLAMGGFIFPLGLGITYSTKGNINDIIIGFAVVFVPYIVLGTLFVVVTGLMKLRHSSLLRRNIAIVGPIMCALIVIWAIATLLNITSMRWQGTYPDMGSMNGGQEWIAAWLGGYASGLLILFLGYLRLSQPFLSPHSK